MARRSLDVAKVTWLREMPLTIALSVMRDAGRLFWRRDLDFFPAKDARTERFYVSDLDGQAWEILITGIRWFDVRAGKGGGGSIDLVMHLLALDFVAAVKLLSAHAGGRSL